ncbi:MAG: hypothetical protein WED04_04350 [Promethearchaeati archaeon SRVP18_Atabeyarchaeia-1]
MSVDETESKIKMLRRKRSQCRGLEEAKRIDSEIGRLEAELKNKQVKVGTGKK